MRTARKIGGIAADARTASAEIPLSRSPLKTQEEAPDEATRSRLWLVKTPNSPVRTLTAPTKSLGLEGLRA
jgi:hypothetical protein